MTDAPEEWRDIPGHEGRYQASSLGRFIGPSGREVRPYVDRQGYCRVGLHLVSGRGQTVMAHRLVAAAFLGPCPDGFEVAHKDHDRANNRADNLEYLTHAANVKATAAAGRSMRGEVHNRAAITEDVARAIIAEYQPPAAAGRGARHEAGMGGLARRYKTTLRVVRGILHGETWKHLPRDHNPHIAGLKQRPDRPLKKRSSQQGKAND